MNPAPFEDIQQALASRIKELRKASGMPQEELAHQSGIDRTYVSQLERCCVNPSLAVLVRVASALQIEVVALLMDA